MYKAQLSLPYTFFFKIDLLGGGMEILSSEGFSWENVDAVGGAR